jgi:hypothetical protein
VKQIELAKATEALAEYVKNIEDEPVVVVQRGQEMVDKADMYIGIYAWRYGHMPEGYDISITEMEFDRAIERGIPILAFTMHHDHPPTITMVKADKGAHPLIF